jgi:hypothetical protein
MDTLALALSPQSGDAARRDRLVPDNDDTADVTAALPDSLLVAVLLLLPLDTRMRCAALNRRFRALCASSPALWRSLRFDGVPRTRRRRVDDALLASLVQRSAGALSVLDLSLLPRGRCTAPGVLSALRECSRLQLLLAWRQDASYEAQEARALEFAEAAEAATAACAVVPLVALTRAHVASENARVFCATIDRLIVCDGPNYDPAASAAVAAGFVETLVDVLEAHASNAWMQRQVLRVLWAVLDGVSPYYSPKDEEEEEGVVTPQMLAKTIVSLRAGNAAGAALVKHTRDADVTALALDVMHVLLDAAEWKRYDRGAHCLPRADVFAPLALFSMELNAGAAGVQHACLRLLMLDCVADVLLQKSKECHAIDLVLRFAEAHPADAAVQADSVHALSSLLECRQRAGQGGTPLQPPELMPRVMRVLVGALRVETDRDTNRWCTLPYDATDVLKNAFVCGTVGVSDVLACGAIGALAGTLRDHAADGADAMPLCHAVIALFTLLTSTLRLTLLAGGAVVVLPVPPVAAAAAALAAEVSACCSAAVQAGALQAMSEVQALCLTDVSTQYIMCMLVGQLLPRCPTDAAILTPDDAAALDAACAMVVTALRAHPSDANGGVGESGLIALLACASHSDACRARLLSAGGAGAALAVLAATRDAETVTRACAALYVLTADGEAAASAVAAAGALPGLSAALRLRFRDADPDAAVELCDALTALGASGAPLDDDAVEDALAALRDAAALAHPGAQALRNTANAARRSLAASPVAAPATPDDDAAAAS